MRRVASNAEVAMSIYIAFLRGINVGGKNKLKMADLKHMLEGQGLVRVETYIQSGNVIFESDEGEEYLRTKLAREIERAFGITTVVVLRTVDELKRLIQGCPFSLEEIARAEMLNTEGESMYADLLTRVPDIDTIRQFNAIEAGNDEWRFAGRDIYILLRLSIRNSKRANNLDKMNLPGTIRNWKTLSKLCVLAGSRLNQ